MAESLRYKINEHLTCCVCLEQFKDPKVLPCLHSFCYGCLVNLIQKTKSDNINCPECRVSVKVDENTVANLPSNFFVNNLVATMSLTDDKPTAKKIVCDNCDNDDDAKSRCNECGMFLCQFCTESHKRYRSTKLHELLTMEQLKSNPGLLNAGEKTKCPKHKDEIIKLFCSTCRITICRDCTIVDHQGHKYGFVEDVVEEEKQRVLKNLDEVKQRKCRVVEGIAYLKKFRRSLEVTKGSTISKINEHFTELAMAVESRRINLVGKATALTDEKQKQIDGQLEALEVALASCQSSIEFTEQAFENSNDVQVLSMEKYILQSLEQLKTVKDQTEPCVFDFMKFRIPSSVGEVKEMVLNKCDVDVAVLSPLHCQASFNESDASFTTDKQYSITLISKDTNNQRIKYGGLVITPSFRGVQVNDVAVTDNGDGSYLISFCLCHWGTLKFKLSINGTPTPSCSLTKPVHWVISDAVGNGVITNNGFGMTGVGNQDEYSCRAGACFFESGVHSWKVEVSPTVFCDERKLKSHLRNYPYYNYNNYNNQVEIGIIDYEDINANIGISQKKTVHSIPQILAPENSLLLTLSLDMTRKNLTVINNGSNVGNYRFKAKRVSPFFACRSGVTLTLVNEKGSSILEEISSLEEEVLHINEKDNAFLAPKEVKFQCVSTVKKNLSNQFFEKRRAEFQTQWEK